MMFVLILLQIKHWYIDFTKLSNNNTDNTLFIVIVRNPYDQLRSLSLQPHHAPFHFEIGLSNFLRKKWLSYDLESTTNWLTPDSWWLALPEYLIESEKNVCVLRNKKNKNFLGLQNKVKKCQSFKIMILGSIYTYCKF
jgi:hypothetical protein